MGDLTLAHLRLAEDNYDGIMFPGHLANCPRGRHSIVELGLGLHFLVPDEETFVFLQRIGQGSKRLGEGGRQVKRLFRFKLLTAIDDGQPVFHGVAGSDEIAFAAREIAASVELGLTIRIGVSKSAGTYFRLFEYISNVTGHISVVLPGNLRDLKRRDRSAQI